MKMDKLGTVVVKSRATLTGSLLSYVVETIPNGSHVEKFTVLDGKRPIEFAFWAAKGSKIEDIKQPEWTRGRFPVCIVVNPEFDVDVWKGKGQLRAGCDSIEPLEQ